MDDLAQRGDKGDDEEELSYIFIPLYLVCCVILIGVRSTRNTMQRHLSIKETIFTHLLLPFPWSSPSGGVNIFIVEELGISAASLTSREIESGFLSSSPCDAPPIRMTNCGVTISWNFGRRLQAEMWRIDCLNALYLISIICSAGA